MMPSEEIKNVIEEQLQSSTNTKKLNMAPFVSRLRAETYRKASYRIMEKTLGIDIQQRGKQNFTALIERLRSGDKSHTPQMRELLQSKKKPNVVLTPEERKFLSEMLKRDWVLKHATYSVEEIKKIGKMLSLEERKRQGMDTNNAHTPSGEGHIDNVFFTYGPVQGLKTVRFMGASSSVVTIDPEELGKHNPKSLHGLWGSDHFYSYTTEQEGFSTRIGDCQYSVYYRNAKDSETESGVHLVRMCRYDRADGTSFIQQFAKGEEIFTHPRIKQGMLLSVIEKIRFMGYQTWNLVMNTMSIEEQERLVQVLFHPGVFEVHQPRLFSINQPGVQIVHRAKEIKTDAESRALVQLSQSIFEAAFAGRMEEVLNFCQKHQDIFSDVKGSIGNSAFNSVSLLGAAILGGHVALVKALLERGVDMSNNYKAYVSVSPLILVFCLVNPKKNWNITPNKAAAFEIMRLLVEVGTADINNPHLRHLLPVTSEELKKGLEEYCADPDFILYLLNILGTRLNPSYLPLASAVNTRSVPLVKKMLSLGAKLDLRLNTLSGNLESGCTPLLIAAANGDESMIRLLIGDYQAPIDQEFSSSSVRGVQFVHALEGYTPLLAAVEEGHLPIVQLLVEAGANVLHRSAVGRTALFIAIEKGHSNIRDYLQIVISKLKDIKEMTELQTVEQAQREAAKIQKHQTHIVFTGTDVEGKRFFVVQQVKADTLFPFMSTVPTREINGGVSRTDIYKNIITTINKSFGLDIHFSKLKWGSVAEFSCYVPENEIYYAENVIFCELDNPQKIKEKILSSHYHSLKLVTESDWTCYASKKNAIQDLWWPNMSAALFSYINKMLLTLDDKVSKEEYESLNECYQETVRSQHQMMQAAKTGDLEKIAALITKDVALWHPTLTQEASHLMPWQMAFQNEHFDCAIYILKNSHDIKISVLEQCITADTISDIIEKGQLELYKVIHEMKYEDLDFSKRAMSVRSWYWEATDRRQKALACYIAASTSLDNGPVFSSMVEALLSMKFEQVLNSLEALPHTAREQFLQLFILPKMITEIVHAGCLDLYKKIHETKNKFTDFALSPTEVEAFFDTAIASKHQALVCYIADCMSEHGLAAMVAAIQSQSCDRALELFKIWGDNLSEKCKALNAYRQGMNKMFEGFQSPDAEEIVESDSESLVVSENMVSKCLNHYLDCNVISQIIASGHLEFCKVLHERGLENMVCTVSLDKAIEYNQESIALYILQTLHPEEAHKSVLIRAAEHRGLMNVVALLSPPIVIDKPVSEEPVRLYVREFDAVRDEIKAPKVDGKSGNAVRVTGQKTT